MERKERLENKAERQEDRAERKQARKNKSKKVLDIDIDTKRVGW